ncbi:MAG: DNA replication/repair protein RecF [Actinomycetota bacterium]|nr:DNA replication/repair protein RecF [Actinomycetota bacterium]
MPLRRLWLTDFRNYISAEVNFGEGTTAVTGANGQGKTNLVEAIAWLARGSSFRGAPTEALVRRGVGSAILRAETGEIERPTMLEVELVVKGRNRMQVNGNKVGRVQDLIRHFSATIFGPDDLVLIKGGPSERRAYLDTLLVDLHPRIHPVIADLERILRQRNALLRQAGGRLSTEVGNTLDVWDGQLQEVGEVLVEERRRLVESLSPLIDDHLKRLTDDGTTVSLSYESSWSGMSLSTALKTVRPDDLRRGTTTVGPHRDELEVVLNGLPTRHQASQGEQRSLALAMRLAGHRLVAEKNGIEPLVVLDDIFSELDEIRSAALVALLPQSQAVLTSAGDLPYGVEADHRYRVSDGKVEAG